MNDSSRLEISRGALWEDVLHGAWFAGLLGLLLYPTMGLVLTQAGLSSLGGQGRGVVLSGLVFLAASWARTRIASLAVLDPEEQGIHDAVRIGRTIYIQSTVAFDQVEALYLARREQTRVLSDRKPEEETPLEGRGELHLGSGRVLPISNWVAEDRALPSSWSRLQNQLNQASELLGVPLEEMAQVAPPVWEIGRAAAWVAAISATAAFLVVFAS